MSYYILPEGYVADKQFNEWLSFRQEVIDKGEDFKELNSLWSEYAPDGFMSLNRSEGGICTGQSNLEHLQVRISDTSYPGVMKKFSIVIHFVEPSRTTSPTWNPDLIKSVYIAF